MRSIIPHSKPKQEAKAAVERSIVQIFAGFNLGPIEFINQRKQWSGDTMIFSLTAKLGFLQTSINGSASVTDSELILDVDLWLIRQTHFGGNCANSNHWANDGVAQEVD